MLRKINSSIPAVFICVHYDPSNKIKLHYNQIVVWVHVSDPVEDRVIYTPVT